MIRPGSIASELTGGRLRFESLQEDRAGFAALAAKLHNLAGIYLADNSKNRALMASRLSSLLVRFSLANYQQLLAEIARPNSQVSTEFIQSLTTNTTHFFREGEHFSVLKHLGPEIAANGKRRGDDAFRIWCAAASSGQEPYSILMTLSEVLAPVDFYALKFLASDIDLGVLAEAADGIYSRSDLRDVPRHLFAKFFDLYNEADCEQRYRVKPQFANLVRFARVNLVEWPFPFNFQFDVIFCRNVLIYFDRATHGKVINELGKSLKPGGYLFLGHCDGGASLLRSWAPIAPAVWRKDE